MLRELISEAIALAGAAAIGHGIGVHNERQRRRELELELDRLIREQGVKPWRAGETLPGEPMTDEEWAAWQDAMEEARGR